MQHLAWAAQLSQSPLPMHCCSFCPLYFTTCTTAWTNPGLSDSQEAQGSLADTHVAVPLCLQLNEYLKHVRESGRYTSSTSHEAFVEYDQEKADAVEVSVYGG
jgi:hypothetical protein